MSSGLFTFTREGPPRVHNDTPSVQLVPSAIQSSNDSGPGVNPKPNPNRLRLQQAAALLAAELNQFSTSVDGGAFMVTSVPNNNVHKLMDGSECKVGDPKSLYALTSQQLQNIKHCQMGHVGPTNDCVVCLKARAKRANIGGYNPENFKVEAPLDLLCIDTVGPFTTKGKYGSTRIPTTDGALYATNVMDSDSRKAWTILSATKVRLQKN